MPKPDFTALFDQYPATIAQMPPVFRSHEFILRLAQQHQGPYVEALYAHRDSLHSGKPAPFKYVHQSLARHLRTHKGLVRQIGVVPSRNIFGNDGECSQWERL